MPNRRGRNSNNKNNSKLPKLKCYKPKCNFPDFWITLRAYQIRIFSDSVIFTRKNNLFDKAFFGFIVNGCIIFTGWLIKYFIFYFFA